MFNIELKQYHLGYEEEEDKNYILIYTPNFNIIGSSSCYHLELFP